MQLFCLNVHTGIVSQHHMDIVELPKALFRHQISYRNLLMPLVGIKLLSRISKCSYFAYFFYSGIVLHHLLVSYFLIELSNANNSDMK